MNERKYSPIGSLILALASMIWGFAFTAQKEASRALPPFSVNAIRFFIGALTLFLFSLARDAVRRRRDPAYHPVPFSRADLLAGAVCGTLLFVATTLQQFGLSEGDAGISAALTALYIVFVPLFSAVIFRRRIGWTVILGVAVALAGAYSLSVLGITPGADDVGSPAAFFALMKETSFAIDRPALFAFLCSIVFSFQILSIDRFAGEIDGIRLSMLQFLVAGALGLPPLFIAERPALSAIVSALPPLLFLGILSCGVAYTLQIVGQAKTPPAVAAVVMSLEAVFGALGGILFLGERMNAPEILGCALILTAVLTVELSALGGKKSELPPPDGTD